MNQLIIIGDFEALEMKNKQRQSKKANLPLKCQFTEFLLFKSMLPISSAWLKDFEHPLIGRVSERTKAFTNLSLDTVEELQVDKFQY